MAAGSVADIVPQVVAYIKAEMAANRLAISRLAEVSGIARGSIYAVLKSPDAAGSMRIVCRLADALGLQAEITLIPGRGPAYDPVEKADRSPDPLADPAPTIQRWLGNAVVEKAWAASRPDIAATAARLRMPIEACRLRLLVMGLIEPASPQASELLRTYRPVALARFEGMTYGDIAVRCGLSPREVRAMLRTMAISGASHRPARPARQDDRHGRT